MLASSCDSRKSISKCTDYLPARKIPHARKAKRGLSR
jgi:hypothetical protein